MRRLLVVVILLVIGVAGLGFYQGWFHLASETQDQKSKITLSVDREKLKEDEAKAKETAHKLGEKAKESAHELSDKAKGAVQHLNEKVKGASTTSTDKTKEAEQP